MKCEACKGRGFQELEHGLIMVGCEPCDGTGEMPKEAPYTGLLFQLVGKRTDECSDDDLWAMAKEACLEKIKFPHTIEMPCGNSVRWNSPSDILDLIPVNVLCACDNPNHYIVRFVDEREALPIGVSASGGIPEGMEIPESKTTASPDAGDFIEGKLIDNIAKVGDDNISGTIKANQFLGSPDTSKPKQPKKRKTKGKAKKRARKILQKAK